VQVFAQQFAWRFDYDGGRVQSDVLVLPVDRSVEFNMESADVIHSLWIPEMGQKQDVVPGITTEIVITPTRTGEFTLICTELCGLGHSTMRAAVRVLEPHAFDAWLEKQGAEEASSGAVGGNVRELGRTTFGSAGCGGCHAFTPAGTDAEIGPSLDDLAPEAEKAGEPVREYVRQSIVDPNAVVVQGYQSGVMPTTFGETLSSEELDALVAYLSGEGAE
jgi:cytochrome c oxidase subunit 2